MKSQTKRVLSVVHFYKLTTLGSFVTYLRHDLCVLKCRY